MKNELRKKCKEIRKNITDKTARNKEIQNTFIKSELFEAADTVMLYSPSGSEISTDIIFDFCLKQNKRVAFPICLDSDGTMDFYLVRSIDDLAPGMYGIQAPKKECEILIPTEKTVCIVPGLSFDTRGYRLGYGKGYYDRYLSRFSLITVGLCYEELFVPSLPINSNDKKVDYLITDKKIYNTNSEEDFKNG